MRHGESVGNDAGVTMGWTDCELSDKGFEQANKVAERLKDEKIDVIYSSDLKRASRTAEEIAKFHDCELILDKRLREQKKGKYEGDPAKKLWDDFRASDEDILDWVPEGGESMGVVKNRVMNFLSEIKEENRGETVLVVSHGGALAVLSRTFCDEMKIDEDINSASWKKHKHWNTSVSEYSFDGEKWNVDSINCVRHLG